MMSMNRSGRASWVLIAGLVGVGLVIAILFLGGESPTAAAGKFMTALSKGDVRTLTDLSYLSGENKDQIERQWDYAVNVAGPYYRFKYSIRSERIVDSNDAAVSLSVWRNYFSGISYDEKFELPMIKQEGKWLVDVRGINREMFPALPR